MGFVWLICHMIPLGVDLESIPSGVNFFTTRRHRVRVVKEVDLLGAARASSNLVGVLLWFFLKILFQRTRSWSSGYDRRLPSDGPGFNSRRAHVFAFPSFSSCAKTKQKKLV